MYALIADIGGTNIRLSLVNKNAEILFPKYYKCADYPSLKGVLQEYIGDVKIKPKHALIAVAAAIMGDYVVMTNHNWEFSISQLGNELGLDSLKIINDFEAQALAVEYLTADDIKTIHGENVNFSKWETCRTISGPGTGFGNALLYNNHGKWHILPTEIGHSVIGSCNALENEIFQWVKKNYDVNEPYGELFISGGGILRIYNALKAINGSSKSSDNFTANLSNTAAALTPYDISINSQTDPLCRQTIEVFYGLLGTLVGNIALSYLPFGGIYLTGGIIPQTLNADREAILVERFLDRKLDTVKAILQKTPIYLIQKENPAMLGLAQHVAKSI
jgi:glucokinase